jgi:molybdopterin/thiamine biosynthesis adenylyltransferase
MKDPASGCGSPLPELSDDERLRYQWQLWVQGFGEEGQRRLKAATVFISRVGGVGGTVAYYLAAAGIGRLVLAHAGEVRLSDLNRQLLMSSDAVGNSRVETAAQRLTALNPRLEVVTFAENVTGAIAADLVRQADVVASCAPLFSERLAMNEAAVRAGKPLVDCAMFEFDLQLTTVRPGASACLACLYPSEPPQWKREFPVFGAVAGSVGSLAAVEVIKLLANVGEPLVGRMLLADLATMRFQTVATTRRPDCPICGGAAT